MCEAMTHRVCTVYSVQVYKSKIVINWKDKFMEQNISFQVIRSYRRSISIEINPEGKVIVKAPILAPMFLIKRFVHEKRNWIEKHLSKQKTRIRKTKEYKEGEKFLYLGKEYQLHLGNFKEINLATNGLLNFPQALIFRAQKELTNWYIKQAKNLITDRVKHHALKMNVNYGTITFSDTRSKWGTCTFHNNLQFSSRLIMAPIEVIDYVIIHELTHTKEKNHRFHFWSLVGSQTPAYKQHRKWLKTNGHSLMI